MSHFWAPFRCLGIVVLADSLPYGNPKTLLRSSEARFTVDSPVNYPFWGMVRLPFIFRNYTRNVLEVFWVFWRTCIPKTPLKTRPLEAAPNRTSSGALPGAGFTSRSGIRVASWVYPGSPGNWHPRGNGRPGLRRGRQGGSFLGLSL